MERPSSSRSSGGCVGRIALAGVALVVALSASELLLRSLPERTSQGLRGLHEARPDRPWLYGLRPGARATLDVSGDVLYEINTEGFRDRSYARPKPPGVFRIAVLGDSLTFGYGVALEDTFVKRLETRLGDGFEVLNLGVGGYNPWNEAALFADVGIAYEADVVLVQFCTNDLNDPTLHFDAQTLLHLGAIPEEAFPDPSVRRAETAGGWSRALSGCRALALCARLDDAWIRWRATRPSNRAELAALRSSDKLDDTQKRWLAHWYRDMAERANGAGARFAVVAFPFRGQLEGGATDELQAQLVAMGRGEGWETFDLLPAFREVASTSVDAPLFLDAWHPTVSGHEVAADAIAESLERLGWLPELDQ